MGGAMGLYSGFRNPFLCFTAGTQVMLRQDEAGNYVSIDIEDIREGDLVLARDEDDPTGVIGLHRVAQKFVRTSHFITHLAIRDVETGDVENLETTDEHPFWVLSKGWTTGKNLEPGDLVLNPDNTYATVESNHETFHPEGVTVYNFEVEGVHTYFVADGLGLESFVWVHNATYDDLGVVPQRVTSHDAGVQKGRQHAMEAYALRETDWVNPFEDFGQFGQGFDDILEDGDGFIWILEYKGGRAELSPGQMGQAWVKGNIDRLLDKAPWSPWGPKLKSAFEDNKLRGLTIRSSDALGDDSAVVDMW